MRYHTLAWGLAVLTAFLVLGLARYGVSLGYICWIHESETTGFSTLALIVFYAPVAFIFCFSLYVLVTAYRAFGAGMPDTIATRKRVLKHSQNYVRVFGLYLMLTLLSWAIHLIVAKVDSDDRSPSTKGLVYFDVALRLIRGPVDAVAWFLNHPHPSGKEKEEEEGEGGGGGGGEEEEKEEEEEEEEEENRRNRTFC